MSRNSTHAQAWLTYGLIAGSAMGAVLLALTGSILWIDAFRDVDRFRGTSRHLHHRRMNSTNDDARPAVNSRQRVMSRP